MLLPQCPSCIALDGHDLESGGLSMGWHRGCMHIGTRLLNSCFKHQIGSDRGTRESILPWEGYFKVRRRSADKGVEDRRGSIGSGYQGKGGENGRVSFS